MPIYSNNRTGSMAVAQISANESYTSEDFGRILYESQLNDMAFFEAVLACDFNEINGLREGTILKSEVAALNEASMKAVVDKLIDGVRKFWAKLKGAFKDCINKIGIWMVKIGKPMAQNIKLYDYKSWKGSISGVKVYNADDPAISNRLGSNIYNDIVKAVTDKDTNVSTIVGDYLGRKLKKGSAVSPKEYHKLTFEENVKTITMDASNVESFAKDIDDAKTYIGLVKGYQNAAEKQIDSCIKELRAMGKSEGNNAMKVNSIVRAYETILATMCKTNIALLRADMKSKSAALSRAMSDMKKFNESAAEIEAYCIAEAFDEIMTCRLSGNSASMNEAAALIASV